jgi:hypothetical protein
MKRFVSSVAAKAPHMSSQPHDREPERGKKLSSLSEELPSIQKVIP